MLKDFYQNHPVLTFWNLNNKTVKPSPIQLYQLIKLRKLSKVDLLKIIHIGEYKHHAFNGWIIEQLQQQNLWNNIKPGWEWILDTRLDLLNKENKKLITKHPDFIYHINFKTKQATRINIIAYLHKYITEIGLKNYFKLLIKNYKNIKEVKI
ncbi:hypothetical protein BCF59_0521 [Mycoplasmopsis mustelae]|uniref:Uncharacterized protein n=1 Tax=Mycoplasmopsis mustelae TaxID=171289 RepID=A0A4R7UDL9_9BACT|nr:hypothetical protein [Mycoplasmopsis mustelae]TDV23530.1 hypothetical protein BCF59_0521 [Mycoplasmopsis mustelae]